MTYGEEYSAPGLLARVSPVKTSRSKILCVDDEPANLRFLEAVLAPRGYDVLKAGNGPEALQTINNDTIDFVLLDVMMPGMDGFEVCRRIKQDENLRSIPVVMITALASKEDRVRSIESGAEDFITKPIDKSEVLARISTLLKIKHLNERLNTAYGKITRLIAYGESVIRTFDPLNYDLLSMIDSMVTELINSTVRESEAPKAIIVGIPDDHTHWRWYRYETRLGKTDRYSVRLDMQKVLHLFEHNRILFFNEADIDKPDYEPFLRNLKPAGIAISNTVSYLSGDFCIFALNFGREVTKYDAAVFNSLIMQSLFLKSLSNQVRETEEAFEYTVHALSRAAEVNDEDTGNHIVRVGEYSALVAKKLGLPPRFVSAMRLQAQMHDVGKLHIHPDTLKKAGKLTPEEWDIMKQHTVYGAKILGDHARFSTARTISMSHHERWDGSGYPHGLKGDLIPLEGRIVTIADQYDALRNRRVYKPAFDHEATYKIITEGDGRTMPDHFDPEILELFRAIHGRFQEIYEKLKD